MEHTSARRLRGQVSESNYTTGRCDQFARWQATATQSKLLDLAHNVGSYNIKINITTALYTRYPVAYLPKLVFNLKCQRPRSMPILMAEPSGGRVFRALRLPTGDDSPHFIHLEYMKNFAHGWDKTGPNILAFWGKEGWEKRILTFFPANHQKVTKYILYQTYFRGSARLLEPNKYVSTPDRIMYGDAFLVKATINWTTLATAKSFEDLEADLLESQWMKKLIDHHGGFEAGQEDARILVTIEILE